MATLEVIKSRLNSDHIGEKAMGALELASRPSDVSSVIGELIAALDFAVADQGDLVQSKSVLATFALMALSKFLEVGNDATEKIEMAEHALLRHLNSADDSIAAAAIFWTGQLHGKGMFAWDELAAIAQNKASGVSGGGASPAAFALRALIDIDEERIGRLALGPATADLLIYA